MSPYGHQYVSQAAPRRLVADESHHHPSRRLEQADLGPMIPCEDCEDAVADNLNDHHRTIAGSDFSVARIPIEMYRRRITRPFYQRGHQDVDVNVNVNVDTDGVRNTHRSTDNNNNNLREDPQYIYKRRTHLVELCFHSDFDPRPDTPSSLHFNNDNVVTHWRAPDLPEIPPLRPPNYLVEYDTLRLYPDDDRQQQQQQCPRARARARARAATALMAANVGLLTRWDWVHLTLLSLLFIALLFCPVPYMYGRRPDDDGGHDDAQIRFSPNFSSLSLPYDVYDMVMLWSSIPVGLLDIRLQDANNDSAGGSNHRAFPGPPDMDPIAFSSLPKAAQHYAIHKASSRQAPLDELRALLDPAVSLASWILGWVERYPPQDIGKEPQPPRLLSYSSFRQLGHAARLHLNEAMELWHRVESDAVDMHFHADNQIWRLLGGLEEQAAITDSEEEEEEEEEEEYGFFVDTNFPPRATSTCACACACADQPCSADDNQGRCGRYTHGRWAELCKKWPAPSTSLSWEVSPGTRVPPPARVSRLLDLFHLALIRGRYDGDPRYGREEAAFLERVCHPPSPGSGRLLTYPACSPGALASSSLQAWESWARSGWKGVEGTLDYNGWDPPVFEQEPDLLALARHLTVAGSLMDIILDTIRQIPTSWILEGGRAHERFEAEQETRRQVRQEGEGHEEHKEHKEHKEEDSKPPWLQSLLHPFQQRNQKQIREKDGARTMASLLNITASLAELRSTTLLGQETVALQAVAGVLHVHHLWQDLGKELENLMADGGGEGWWSSCAGGLNTRRRIPSARMMAIIIGDLLKKVEAVERVSFDWWYKVSDATLMYYTKWFWDRGAEDERLR